MDFDLTELDDETDFEDNPEFEERWWQRLHIDRESTRVAIRSQGLEVARVELVGSSSGSQYTGVPDLREHGIEIAFFEVASTRRGQRIGTRLVEILATRYPNRRLFAFSEGADEFWSGLGWDRFEHPDGVVRYRPLYVQPQ